MLWGEERKCYATVVGLDLVLALSKVRRCSLKRSFKRRLIPIHFPSLTELVDLFSLLAVFLLCSQ